MKNYQSKREKERERDPCLQPHMTPCGEATARDKSTQTRVKPCEHGIKETSVERVIRQYFKKKKQFFHMNQ